MKIIDSEKYILETDIKEVLLDFATVSLKKDGIVRVEIMPEIQVSVDQVKQIAFTIKTIGNDKIFPVLILPGKYTIPDEHARKFLASNNSKNNALAEAYVVEALSQKLVANFYMKFHKPQRPTKIFESEKEALEWLKCFRLNFN